MKEKLRKYFFSLRKNKYFNLKEKDFNAMRKWVVQNLDKETSAVFKDIKRAKEFLRFVCVPKN